MSKKVKQHEREDCFFCGSEGPIQTHHIIPQRLGGRNMDENLVDLCPTCHQRLEQLYDDEFYEAIGPIDNESELMVSVLEYAREIGTCSRREMASNVAQEFGISTTEARSILSELVIRDFLKHNGPSTIEPV